MIGSGKLHKKKSRRVEVICSHTPLYQIELTANTGNGDQKIRRSIQGALSYNGLHGKSPLEMGTFFRPGGGGGLNHSGTS